MSQAGKRSLTVRCAEVMRLFGPFGFTAFGGPAANIVTLRKIFVIREKWVDEKTFTDLFALGSALPGPAFSQLAFSVALLRGGYIPALLSFVLLTAPGAIAMLGLGLGVRHIPPTLPDIVFALFTGLNAAAVGLITLAAYTLSAKVITDPLTRIEVLLSAVFAICYESQWLYPVLMVVGGISTLLWDVIKDWSTKRIARREEETPGDILEPDVENNEMQEPPPPITESSRDRPPNLSHRRPTGPTEPSGPEPDVEPYAQPSPYFSLSVPGGLYITASFIIFLIIVLVLRATVLPQRAFEFFANLLLAGTIIFGGGPVVIPLLRTYTVDPGWVSPRDFLLGFAVIQALPGPLFNFSVFLGVLTLPSQPILGALLGCIAIFLPGITLKLGLLPLYTRWRASKTTRSVLRGLNATAVGLIFAATYRLFRVGFLSPVAFPVPASPDSSTALYTSGSLDNDGWWVAITASTFVACEWFGLPAPVAIVGGALGGMAWWGVRQ